MTFTASLGWRVSRKRVLINMNLIEKVENHGKALKVEELAELTTISKKTLYRMIKARKLPAIRIGGSVRLEPKATAEWLRSRLA